MYEGGKEEYQQTFTYTISGNDVTMVVNDIDEDGEENGEQYEALARVDGDTLVLIDEEDELVCNLVKE